LRVLPPDATMPSTDRNTSSQLLLWRVLAMKLSCTDASTFSGAQLRNHEIMPSGRSADAVGRYSSFGRALPVSCAM
jgi:hypothetical protein